MYLHLHLYFHSLKVASIRTEYNKFREVVDAVFESEDWEGGGTPTLRDITAMYEPLLAVDILDLSSVGCMAWVASKEAYEGRRDKVRMITAAAYLRQRSTSTAQLNRRCSVQFSHCLKCCFTGRGTHG